MHEKEKEDPTDPCRKQNPKSHEDRDRPGRKNCGRNGKTARGPDKKNGHDD